MTQQFRLGNITFDLCSLDEVLGRVVSTTADHQRGIRIHLANAYNVSLAQQDRKYRSVIEAGDLVLPDSKWVVIAVRAMTGRSVLQIRGADLFRFLLTQPPSQGLRHFLLGSTPTILGDLVNSIEANFASATIAGHYAPPMGNPSDEERADWRRQIAASGANVVWLGLGTPRQDIEAEALAELPGVTVVCVGAAFDFLAGSRREAPHALRVIGLEWLFRLLSEPKRLWRRYIFGNSWFALIAGRQWLANRSRSQFLPE